MNNFHPLEVVDRGSNTLIQVGENLNNLTKRFNPLTAGAAYIPVFIFY